MEKWKNCVLADLGTVVGGATPSTKTPENYKGGSIPWLTPKDLSGFQYRYIDRGERNITERGLNSCSTQLLPKGTVLFTSRAPIGYVAIAKNEVCTNQGFKSVIPNENTDSLFLYYLLKFNKDEIERMGSGTTFKEVSGTVMRGISVRIPEDIGYQKRISALLGLFDDKIELNIRINGNLQQQLSAIFQSTIAESPSLKFMETLPLNDLCLTVTKGTTPTTLGKSFTSQGINFIKAESILDNHSFDINKFAFIDLETNQALKRSVIQSGDILFTIAGSLGRFALTDENILPANTNQAVAIIRADKKKVTPEYLYTFFLGNWHNDYYMKRIQQAVQANLSLGTIKSLPIPILPRDSMEKYVELITPMISLIKTNEKENIRLQNMRDALLPRLMSGEMDASNLPLVQERISW